MKQGLSICIPTYNGAETILATLDSLFAEIDTLSAEHQKLVEIVICDDCSIDNTIEVINEAYGQRTELKVIENTQNLGMDLNFEKVARESTLEYTWYFGQDDLLFSGTMQKVFDYIEVYAPNLLALNYHQVDKDHEVIEASVMGKRYFGSENFDERDHFYYERGSDYFKDFNSAPSFLPATIFKRIYWENFDPTPYYGTAYVQLACILENLDQGKLLVTTEVFVNGLIPDDGWQNNGNALLRIALGNMKAKTIVNQRKPDNMPESWLKRQKKEFTLNYYFFIGKARRLGLNPNDQLEQDMRFVYGHGWLVKLYFLPLMKQPFWTSPVFYLPLKFLKKSLLFFLSKGRVRLKKF